MQAINSQLLSFPCFRQNRGTITPGSPFFCGFPFKAAFTTEFSVILGF